MKRRLKTAKGPKSVKVFSSKARENPKNWTELVNQGDPLGFFNIHSVGKLERGPFGKHFFIQKSPTMPKKN